MIETRVGVFREVLQAHAHLSRALCCHGSHLVSSFFLSKTSTSQEQEVQLTHADEQGYVSVGGDLAVRHLLDRRVDGVEEGLGLVAPGHVMPCTVGRRAWITFKFIDDLRGRREASSEATKSPMKGAVAMLPHLGGKPLGPPPPWQGKAISVCWL